MRRGVVTFDTTGWVNGPFDASHPTFYHLTWVYQTPTGRAGHTSTPASSGSLSATACPTTRCRVGRSTWDRTTPVGSVTGCSTWRPTKRREPVAGLDTSTNSRAACLRSRGLAKDEGRSGGGLGPDRRGASGATPRDCPAYAVHACRVTARTPVAFHLGVTTERTARSRGRREASVGA